MFYPSAPSIFILNFHTTVEHVYGYEAAYDRFYIQSVSQLGLAGTQILCIGSSLGDRSCIGSSLAGR